MLLFSGDNFNYVGGLRVSGKVNGLTARFHFHSRGKSLLNSLIPVSFTGDTRNCKIGACATEALRRLRGTLHSDLSSGISALVSVGILPGAVASNCNT